MCTALKISESGYYRWLRNCDKVSKRQLLLVEIKKILEQHPDNDNYGVKRIHTALEQKGIKTSSRTVYNPCEQFLSARTATGEDADGRFGRYGCVRFWVFFDCTFIDNSNVRFTEITKYLTLTYIHGVTVIRELCICGRDTEVSLIFDNRKSPKRIYNFYVVVI
jgi:hypothetical protein